jgi:Sulfatase
MVPGRRGSRSHAEAGSIVKSYPEGSTFTGRVGRTWQDSEPAFPVKPKAPEGAPNVVYVVLDDVGFGWSDTFGGLVETPNITRLAEGGLRYTNFHTTALCSPTRSCLAEWAQPPLQRHGQHHRAGHRLSRL